ncbi:MAG: outer membrane lipoprotein carrier protein LolA [Phycisphaerae bacterium]|nr:outer membrane lipoprotein carrier protein LolA [Phycisphaerae bacterium]
MKRKTPMYYLVLSSILSLCLVNLACGEKNVSVPKNESSPSTAKTEKPVVNPTAAPAKAILDRLEQAGQKYATLRAEVEFEVVNRMTGERIRHTGWVAYQKEIQDQPARFRVHFDTQRLEDGPKTKEVVDYFYDGQFFTRDQYKTKTRTRWQVAAEGERVEALKIGKGPFPVPFGQKTADVLSYLQAGTRNPQASDPPDTDYLKLTPLPGKDKDVNFIRLEMWVSRKTHLPVKIHVRDAEQNAKTVIFANTKTDTKVDEKLLNPPKPAGFELIVQRMGK